MFGKIKELYYGKGELKAPLTCERIPYKPGTEAAQWGDLPKPEKSNRLMYVAIGVWVVALLVAAFDSGWI